MQLEAIDKRSAAAGAIQFEGGLERVNADAREELRAAAVELLRSTA